MKINKRWLQSKSACTEGINWVVQNCNGKEGIDVVKALMKDDKLDWANWLIVRTMTRPQYLAYVIYAAEQAIDIFEKKYPNDKRPRFAIEAAKAVLKNDNQKTRAAAWAAGAAAWAAVRAAAGDAARDAAGDAAGAAAWAAGAAARDAAGDAARDAAWDAARDAAGDAAGDAMQIKILNYGLKLLKDSDEAKAE